MIDILIYPEKPPIQIDIGNQGENNCRNIMFNLEKWRSEYPNGLVSIYFQRPDMNCCYPVLSGGTSNLINWSPDSVATAVYGRGQLIIKLTENDVIIKSVMIQTLVLESPDFAGTPPDASTDWLTKVEQYAISVNQSKETILLTAEEVTIQASLAKQSADSAKESEQALIDSGITVAVLTNQEIEALLFT